MQNRNFTPICLLFLCLVVSGQVPKNQPLPIPGPKRTTASPSTPPSSSPVRPVKPTVYVAKFTSRQPLGEQLLTSFTNDFETALIGIGSYTVIERREIDQLLDQVRNETALRTIKDLGMDLSGALRTRGASAVIFGNLDDDVGSGEYVITVKMEYFDSTISWQTNTSMRRGMVADRSSRVEAVNRLVGRADQLGRPSIRALANEFLFQLIQCVKTERTVACSFEVTNNGEDRVLQVGIKSNLFDQESRVTYPSVISIAGNSRIDYGQFVQQTLISGRPARLQIEFQGVASNASEISRLELLCHDGGHDQNFRVEFKNIRLPQN
jgi:hypothetical protein